MTGKTEIHVFTQEELKQHDKEVATDAVKKAAPKIHQMSVKSTIRKMNEMTPPQQLRAAVNGGSSLYWSEEQLNKALEFIGDND
ncbi:hypothetical protein M5238_003812 [Vibrio vulnificus]|uniref:hypothetical protein n=1 Tax=Vibrio alfacsensis TaxID=1074311 RepID=UPI002A32DB4A|nr:hypothetical protein [Vibrio vulnificus]